MNKILSLSKFLFLSSLLFVHCLSAQTVNYTMQTGNFNANQTVHTNSNYFAGYYNNGASELGFYANGSGSGYTGDPGIAAFQTFTTTGNGNSGTARPLRVGDQFTITAYVGNSSNFFNGSNAGISFNGSTTYTAFSNYNTTQRAKFQINKNGNWFPAASSTGSGFATPGFDRTFTLKVTSAQTVNMTMSGPSGTTNYDMLMESSPSGTSDNISSFAIWNQSSGNGNDMFWKNASLTSTGTVELGGGNGTSTISGVISDGLEANSTSVIKVNSLTKLGSGVITLSAQNTYTGLTTVSSGTLALGRVGGNTIPATNAVTVSSGAVLKISTSQTLSDLTVASGGTVTVEAGATLTVTGTLTNNGSITLKAASESSYAQLLPSGTVSGSGTVTMEKSVTGSTAGWRFVSAPVTGGTLANFGSNVLIRSTPPNNIITLNTANPNAWVGFNSLGQSTSSAIGAGKGYALYYGGASGVNGSTVASTLSLSGGLSTSNVSVSGLSEGSVADIYGWSLVGNPFTCGISLSGLTRSNVAEAYYIWDVNKSGGAGFASYVGSTSTPAGALNGVIPPMQGFLVKATAVSPSLTIPTSARTVATPNAQLRGTSSFTHRMYLRISEPQSGKWDETALLSDPQATALFEGSFDAYKLNSWDANALNLATMSSDNQRLSINTTGDWDASLQVPLQLTTTLNGPMQLTANVSEVAAGQPLWLEDLHTGAYHDLRAGAYSFTHLSNVADRFRIHFRALSTSVKPEPLAGVLVYAYEGRLYVQGLEGACRLEVVDVRGRLVASTELESGEGSGGWLPAVAPGIYGVRCRTEQGMKVVKVRF